MYNDDERRYNFVTTIHRAMKRMFGVNLSKEKIDFIIGDEMNEEYKQFSYKDMDEYLETEPRDQLLNIISMHFIGEKWPKVGSISDSDFEIFLNKVKKEMRNE